MVDAPPHAEAAEAAEAEAGEAVGVGAQAEDMEGQAEAVDMLADGGMRAVAGPPGWVQLRRPRLRQLGYFPPPSPPSSSPDLLRSLLAPR